MPRGRPTKSEKEKKLNGDTGKRRPKKPRTPEPAQICARTSCTFAHLPPDWLDIEGKRKWLEMAPQLDECGHPIEPDILATYCQSWSEFLIATNELNNGDRTFETEKGYVGQHPAVKQQRSAMEQLRACAKLLGLTGARRPPAKAANPDVDPLDGFLAERSR